MSRGPAPRSAAEPLRLLSVVIPMRNEEGAIASTVEHLYVELRLRNIPHEIVTVDDGSTDSTWAVVQALAAKVPTLRPVRNTGEHGFGRAVICGIDQSRGDAVVIMMADESDDCRDVVRYWELLGQGWDAVFGSRFLRGGGVIDYPPHKLFINRAANLFLRLLFGVPFNDFTNAFKAYRRYVIDQIQPLLSNHFNLTVEMPLKAVVRGYNYAVVPVTWTNRRHGVSKLKLQEMGSRYAFIILYVWLEHHLSRGDYRRKDLPPAAREAPERELSAGV